MSRASAATATEEAFATGGEAALAAAYQELGALVYSIALRSLGDPEDAADVTQHVFVAAWRARARYDVTRAKLSTWLVGIARHKISDVRALRAREAAKVVAIAALPDADATRGDQSADQDVTERLVVRQAVEELPDPRRTILFLAFWEERSHTEIAEAVGLPLGTVKSHVRRGLIQLHQTLEGVRHVPR